MLFRSLHWFAASQRKVWPFGRTLAGIGIVWLSLFAAMALIGVVHQVAWLAASREPVYFGNRRFVLGIVASQAKRAVKKGVWDELELQNALNRFEGQVEAVLLRDDDGKIRRVFLIGREGQQSFIEVQERGTSIRRPIRELRSTLNEK